MRPECLAELCRRDKSYPESKSYLECDKHIRCKREDKLCEDIRLQYTYEKRYQIADNYALSRSFEIFLSDSRQMHPETAEEEWWIPDQSDHESDGSDEEDYAEWVNHENERNKIWELRSKK